MFERKRSLTAAAARGATQLHNSRRLVTRRERHVENFVAMLQLGCMPILLNRL